MKCLIMLINNSTIQNHCIVINYAHGCFMHVPTKMHSGLCLVVIFNIMGKFPEISS